MKTKKLILTLILGHALAWSALAQTTAQFTSAELAKRTIQRRAVEAAIWGEPIVMYDAMRQAYFRDAKAKYNDIIWWPKGADWRSQDLTPNSVARYIFFHGNTAVDGPVVFELPAGDPDGLRSLSVPSATLGGSRSWTSATSPGPTRARVANT